MGAQQLLLIVLSVILVAVAISVGIVMFNRQAYNSNRQAIVVELNIIQTKALEYWGLPASMGGAGRDPNAGDMETLAAYMGFTWDQSKTVHPDYVYTSENGEYRLIEFNGEDLAIQALGTAAFFGKFPYVSLDLNLLSETQSIEMSSAKNFEGDAEEEEGDDDGNGNNGDNGDGGIGDGNGNGGGNGNGNGGGPG